MYLKSLVMHGFKSFAQRVELDFPRGITAIVGPNGSGKSNVSDAIRWVLGEQNIRNLRGASLPDVIFSGTHVRKPLGMAEVSLTLNNEDGTLPLEYAEITITRRTYRSGESEFFINRTPCRLRDIHELLMDTGLGRDSLAIIGQGEIDAILSAHPEERRALLEEVAGITRYRTKRDQALKRLQQTEIDIERIDDIIQEVERQLTPLQREAQRAEQFQHIQSQLQVLEQRVLAHDWGVNKRAWEAAKQKYEAAHNAWQQACHAQTQREAEQKQWAEAVTAVQQRVESEAARGNELRTQAQTIDASLRVFAERLHSMDAEQQRVKQTLHELHKEKNETKEHIASCQERQNTLQQQSEEAEQRFRAVETEYMAKREEIDAFEAKVQTLRNKGLANYEHIADTQARIRRSEEGLQRVKNRLQRTQEYVDDIQKRLVETEEQGENVRKQLQTVWHKREQFQHELKQIQERIANLTQQMAKENETLAQKRGQFASLRSQRNTLHDLEQSMAGFQGGVRACLQANAPWRAGLFGAVGNLLSVAPKYEIAIEVALGAAAQNIVAVNEKSAQQAIEFLKQRRAGRVTFLPIDALQTRPPIELPSHITSNEQCVGIASQLVTYDKRIAKAVTFLLGRVVIAKTLHAALQFKNELRHVSRFVTLEGDVVRPSGSITGGSHRRQRTGSGVLSRGHRIKQLDKHIASLESEIEDVLQTQAKTKALLDDEEIQQHRMQNKLDHLAHDIVRNERARDVLQERIQSLKNELKRATNDLKEGETERKTLLQEQQQAKEILVSFETDKQQQDEEVEQYEAHLAQLRRQRELLSDKQIEKRNIWQDVLAQCKHVAGEEQHMQQTAARIEQNIEKARDELQQYAQRLATATSEQEEATKESEHTAQAIQKHEEELASLKEKLKSAQSKWQHYKDQEEQGRKEVEQAANALHKYELGMERSRIALQQIEEKLTEAGFSIPTSNEHIVEDRIDDLRQEVKALQKKMKQLGYVNLNALDEYAALQERHVFLLNQRADLTEAKEGLEKAIRDLDVTSRQRLQTTFDEVQKALRHSFPRLFQGGKGKLQWTDPDDVLQSGIEMIVQPPGKRPQPLLTLSGGERALAASSLLFAIMTVRPSPFFVLDEVDAALDAVNVERFAQLLREYGEENQIVIITHRPGTMEKADALFGVTMEKHGASQLVSLRLDAAVSSVQ